MSLDVRQIGIFRGFIWKHFASPNSSRDHQIEMKLKFSAACLKRTYLISDFHILDMYSTLILAICHLVDIFMMAWEVKTHLVISSW